MKEVNPHETRRILVVDDEEGAREALELILEDRYEVETAEDGQHALSKIQKVYFELVLLDVNMPKITGIEVLKRIKEHDDSIDVIMVSAADRAREATDSIKCGAYDYITKPFDSEEILACVQRVMEKRSLEWEVRYLRSEINCRFGDIEIVGQSKEMEEVFQLIEKVAGTSSSILITGESGTGKELVARAIHQLGRRREGPYIQLNCAALNESLLESELFGHVKGAFTGAYNHRLGRFEAASGGDLFLDEIGDVPLSTQVKLLRVLESKQFERVGDHRSISVDVRIITATNRDLHKLVNEGTYREDFFFRINVIPIYLPPLRERMDDIPLLVDTFIRQLSTKTGKPITGLSSEAMAKLMSYRWPGNVRELKSALEYAFVIAERGLIGPDQLPASIFDKQIQCPDGIEEAAPVSAALDEKSTLIHALRKAHGNQSEAARLLGVSRVTVWHRMKRYGIDLKRIVAS